MTFKSDPIDEKKSWVVDIDTTEVADKVELERISFGLFVGVVGAIGIGGGVEHCSPRLCCLNTGWPLSLGVDSGLLALEGRCCNFGDWMGVGRRGVRKGEGEKVLSLKEHLFELEEVDEFGVREEVVGKWAGLLPLVAESALEDCFDTDME